MDFSFLYSYPWVNPIALTVFALFLLWIMLPDPFNIWGFGPIRPDVAAGKKRPNRLWIILCDPFGKKRRKAGL